MLHRLEERGTLLGPVCAVLPLGGGYKRGSGSMWTVLSVVAVISLLAFFMRGPNAVWGGATLGLVVGFVIVIILAITGHNFAWSIIWKAIVVGTLSGLLAQLLGEVSDRLKRKG